MLNARLASAIRTTRGRLADGFHATRFVSLARYRSSALNDNDFETLRARFNSKNVVLVIAPGRCGTDTLTHLFANVPGIVARHEPQPQYRYILHSVQHDPRLAARFFAFIKVPAILEYAIDNYLETSHLFCKGFFEPCLAMDFRPTLLFLSRDLRANALSLLRKTAVPGRTRAGIGYLVSPHDPVYLSVRSPGTFSDYQLCYWYCLEIAHRQETYREICEMRNLRYFNIQTEQLNDLPFMERLARELNFSDGGQVDYLASRVGSVHNALTSSKEASGPEIDFATEECEVMKRIVERAGKTEVLARIHRVAEIFWSGR